MCARQPLSSWWERQSSWHYNRHICPHKNCRSRKGSPPNVKIGAQRLWSDLNKQKLSFTGEFIFVASAYLVNILPLFFSVFVFLFLFSYWNQSLETKPKSVNTVVRFHSIFPFVGFCTPSRVHTSGCEKQKKPNFLANNFPRTQVAVKKKKLEIFLFATVYITRNHV